MFTGKVTVQNATGLHARPATMLTQFCKKFPEKIRLVAGDKEIDPKSIVAVLAGGMKCGTELEVRVEGDNEEAVGAEIIEFINNLTE